MLNILCHNTRRTLTDTIYAYLSSTCVFFSLRGKTYKKHNTFSCESVFVSVERFYLIFLSVDFDRASDEVDNEASLIFRVEKRAKKKRFIVKKSEKYQTKIRDLMIQALQKLHFHYRHAIISCFSRLNFAF